MGLGLGFYKNKCFNNYKKSNIVAGESHNLKKNYVRN